MTRPAKDLWRRIIADRPVDFFRPGSLELLEDYCQLRVENWRLLGRLARIRPDSEEYAAKQVLVTRNSANMLAHATKLRLTVQADAEWASRKMTERGDASKDSRLIGGAALKVVR
jgi:hypothetical protein